DLDIYATFEGDNHILLQLVGKRLLKDYAAQFTDADAATYVRVAAQQVGNRLRKVGLRQLGQSIADFGQVGRSVESLREHQQTLLTGRVEHMVAQVAQVLGTARKGTPQEQQEAFNRQQTKIIDAARAHAELLQWEAFSDALTQVKDSDTQQVLTWVRDLFGLGLIEQHLDWYLITGRI